MNIEPFLYPQRPKLSCEWWGNWRRSPFFKKSIWQNPEYIGKFIKGFKGYITAAARPAKCASCHAGVSTTDDYRNIRKTTSDYDGDGNVTEGIFYEIEGVKAKLYQAIQNYAVIKRGIVFDSTQREPWRRSDTNAAYDRFTPRLVKALYNYHLLYREPGAYVHNSKYVVELLYDSIENLNAGIPDPNKIDLTGMARP